MSADSYLDDDERDRSSARSLLSSGWFRALLVLGALAVVLVVGLPYLLRRLDFSPSSPLQATAPERPAPAPPAAVVPARPAPAAPPGVASLPKDATREMPPKPVTASPTGKPGMPASTAAPPLVPSAPRVAGKAASEPASGSAAAEPDKAAPLSPRADASARRAAPKPEAKATEARSAAPRGGDYWVQVGAFQGGRNAERLAATLREAKLPVHVEQVTRRAARAHRHEVFVTGATVEAVTGVLRGTGTARAVRGGVTVQPPLELKDAVALSRRLSSEGLNVRIRRVTAAEGATFHIVRVGPFPSRARAEVARKDVAATGIGGFVAQGPAR